MSVPRSIHLVDLLKIISAFMVVGIHTQPFRYYNTIQVWLFWPIVSLAVPYFLIVSAYFFWNRETPSLKKYLHRIGLLYVLWLIIDSPILYKELFSNNASLFRNIAYFIRGLIFGQTYPGSWYLSCSIWAVVISYVVWKYKIRTRYLILGGAILYTVGKILIYFQSILPEPIDSLAAKFYDLYGVMQISTFTYFIFVFIGYLMVMQKRYFEMFKSKWWILVGIVITIIELKFNHIFDFPISVIAPLVIIPFMLAYSVTKPFTMPDNVAIRMRKMSTLIYFVHPTFVHLCPPLGKDFVVCHPIYNFVIVSLLSALIAYILSSNKVSKLVPVAKYLY